MPLQITKFLSKCPVCESKFDALAGAEGMELRKGDLAMCIECGVVLRFTEDFDLEVVSQDALNILYKEVPGLEGFLGQAVAKLSEIKGRKKDD